MGTLEASKKTEYVKMIKRGPSKKVEMIFTGLTYIVATLLIVFAVVPTFQTVSTVNKEIKEKQQISKALKSKLEALTSLDSQYNQNKEVFDDSELVFPTTEEFTLLLANIEGITSRNNFVLNAISFSEYRNREYETKATVLQPFSIRVNVLGNKIYLMNFLRDLEKMPMFPAIEGLSFTNEVDDDGNTQYSVMLRVYHIDDFNFYD
jgi:Tfp pilus assembly protein PilO